MATKYLKTHEGKQRDDAEQMCIKDKDYTQNSSKLNWFGNGCESGRNNRESNKNCTLIVYLNKAEYVRPW